jgi:hypothetical protein
VTEETIEEGLLNTLSAKHELALAALDPESDVTQVDLVSGMDELRSRLEVLLGAHPEAAVDVSKKREVVAEMAAANGETTTAETLSAIAAASSPERRERVAAAGGELLGAVFNFLGELVAKDTVPSPVDGLVSQVRSRLDECVEQDSTGRPRLTVTLPDRGALDSLAQTLARLMLAGGEGSK